MILSSLDWPVVSWNEDITFILSQRFQTSGQSKESNDIYLEEHLVQKDSMLLTL